MKKERSFSRRDFIKSLGSVLLGSSILYVLHPGGGRAFRADPKHIYIAPDDHTDLFWTADEDTYRQVFLETLDYYLDQADLTTNEPPAFQSRWNCDGHYWLWTYEKNKSPAAFERLIARIKDGHISVPLNALCVCLGGAPAEAILRGMYYPGQIERRYNLRFSLAYAAENQTLPFGLGALWAGAGAKYSWKGICGCATRVPDAWDRQHDIYWWTGADGSRILMKWNSMLVNNMHMGGYAEARNPFAIVDYVDTNLNFITRYTYRIIGAFGKGWDDLKTLVSEFVTAAKNKTTAGRNVIVSNEEDFFADFEAAYGASLPSLACSYGNEWDLDCATMAEVAARAKRATEKLRGAEALAALACLKDPSFMDGRAADRDLAWMDLGLFWEHDWLGRNDSGFNFVQQRIDWQRRITGEIEHYVDTLHTDAVAALGAQIQKAGNAPRFFAFNPLSWTRTDYVDFPYTGAAPVHVIDLTTGEETAAQFVTVDGERRLRVLADDVLPVGYKVFEVRPGAGAVVFPDAATTNGAQIENATYRVTVAQNGAITSLVDKTRGNREYIEPVNGRCANDPGPGAGTIQVENRGPVTVTLLVTSEGPFEHTARVTFMRGLKRIEIRNDILENFDATHTWGFAFHLEPPDVWHEEVGAVIRAKLTTQNGHYSPRNARYDWLTINHFADMSEAGTGVTLSNADCYFMKLGNSWPQGLDTLTPLISVLAGGRDPNGSALIFNQGGDTHFLQRFALQTHGTFNPVDAMKFALEHQNPLIAGEVKGGQAYPEKAFSLLAWEGQNLLLWALKPADDGVERGLIARVWNMGANTAMLRLGVNQGQVIAAQHATHIETPTGAANVSTGRIEDTFTTQQMKTYLFKIQLSTELKNHFHYLPSIKRTQPGGAQTTAQAYPDYAKNKERVE